MTNRSFLFLCGLALLCAPAIVHADSIEPSNSYQVAPVSSSSGSDLTTDGWQQSQFREGKSWFLSGDLGIGGVGATGSAGTDSGGSAMFFHFRFGGKLSSRLGVSVEFWSDGYNSENDFGQIERYVQNVVALSASYWLSPRLWATTGFGSSTLHDYSGPVQVSNDGSALMVGMGLELFRREKYSIDGVARMISSSYDVGFQELNRISFSVGLGATWH